MKLLIKNILRLVFNKLIRPIIIFFLTLNKKNKENINNYLTPTAKKIKRNMKIGIDCQCLQNHSKNRGIGKYTREFIENLAKKNLYILLFVNSYHEYEIINDIAKKFKNVEINFCFVI